MQYYYEATFSTLLITHHHNTVCCFFINQGGFYDVNKLFFKNVQEVVCVAACAPPGGGRNEVSPRLLRHFHMIWLTNLTEDSMCRIFTSILKGFVLAFLPDFEGTNHQYHQRTIITFAIIPLTH